MEKQDCKTATVQLVGNIFKKVAESAVHAAVFAYVSKKVTNFMTKKEDESKVRVEDSSIVVTQTADATKTGSCC